MKPKWQQVSFGLQDSFNVLTDFISDMVWMISIIPLISSSLSFFSS